MKPAAQHPAPADAAERQAIKPVICYPTDTLPQADMDSYLKARTQLPRLQRSNRTGSLTCGTADT